VRFVRFITIRLVQLVGQLIGISLITFLLVQLIPGDPALQILGPSATKGAVVALHHQLGLDQPIWVQFQIWATNVLHGNLGRSWSTGDAVSADLAQRLPATLELIGTAIVFAFLIMVPLGVFAARQTASRPTRAARVVVRTYGLLAGAFPDFWLALLLIFVFYYVIQIAPIPIGQLDPSASVPRVTGFVILDALLAGDISDALSAVSHLVLPVFTLVFVYGGPILRMTHATMTRMLDSPFCAHARELGVPERTVMRYAFRNSLPPITTVLAITWGYLLGGAVLVETVFSWGGVGQYAVQAIIDRDFAPIQGFVLVAAAFTVVVYLLLDIAYALIDPRLAI
jgi:ABC-type dipeptide/oligopeptide/nickel transport system permease component